MALIASAIRAIVENHLPLSKTKRDEASSGLLQWRRKSGIGVDEGHRLSDARATGHVRFSEPDMLL